ncbi:hypothetical protein GQR58_020741 [Nymphon striatum]|nr:hypothetical protein GQR58_020741 [Nymphon striatum]
MAPALTEAATQAQQSFKLPPSPASSNSNPPSPLEATTEKCLNNELITYSNGFDKNKAILINPFGKSGKIYRGHISEFSETDERIIFGGKNFDKLLNNKMKISGVTSHPVNMGIQQASAKISALETHPKIEMDVPNVKDIMDVDTPASSPYSSSLDNSMNEVIRKSDEKLPVLTSQASLVAPLSLLSSSNSQNVKPILNTIKQSVSDSSHHNVRSLEESIQQSSTKISSIQKKSERLLNRILRLQSKQVGIYLNDQKASFINHHQQNLRMSCPHNCNDIPSVSSADMLQSEEMKSMSTAELVDLVRKIEAKNNVSSVFKNKPNHSSVVRMNSSNFLKSACENTNDNSGVKFENMCIHTERNVKLSTEKCREIKRVSSTISRNLRILERVTDSDATDSSSGGESCDELDGYMDREKTPLKTLPM